MKKRKKETLSNCLFHKYSKEEDVKSTSTQWIYMEGMAYIFGSKSMEGSSHDSSMASSM